jgi:hypothetical protein
VEASIARLTLPDDPTELVHVGRFTVAATERSQPHDFVRRQRVSRGDRLQGGFRGRLVRVACPKGAGKWCKPRQAEIRPPVWQIKQRSRPHCPLLK